MEDQAKSRASSGLRVACYTLGCKVNGYESQAMLEQFNKYQAIIVSSDEAADVYLINTCTVTQIAARKSRQMIRRMKSKNPDALIVACGCYVNQDQQDEKLLSDIADLLIPNEQKKHVAEIVMNRLNRDSQLKEQAFSISSSGEKTRAFLKIQDGCRQYCSYCIIPYVRGPLCSKPVDEAIDEARQLVGNGCREIVLTGIHLSSYGRDLKEMPKLSELIQYMAEIEDLERIRLGSLEVGLITDDFINDIGHISKLCPHFHLSLQSGCDKILRAMNRRYNTETFQEAVRKLRTAFPNAALTTDLIVGFPSETEEDHRQSMKFAEEMKFSDIHVFPYSPRSGTPAAARADQIDGRIKNRRSEEMITLSEKLSAQFHEEQLHQVMPVLAEQYDEQDGVWKGYTPNYCHVHIRGNLERNRIYPVLMNEMYLSGHEPFLMGVLQ